MNGDLDILDNLFDTLIFREEEIIFPSAELLEIKESLDFKEDESRVEKLNKVCEILGCMKFSEEKMKDSDPNYACEFIQNVHRAAKNKGLAFDTINIEGIKKINESLKDFDNLECECDKLEVQLENERENFELLKEAENVDVNILKREISELEDKIEVRKRIKINEVKKMFSENKINEVKEFKHTKFFKKHHNFEKEEEIKKKISEKTPKNNLQRILIDLAEKETITITELEEMLKIDKIEVLKIIFMLAEKNVVKVSNENEFVSLKF